MSTQDEQGYNGWSSYETWAVNLHLTNEQGLYAALDEIVGRSTDTVSERADMLKEFTEEVCAVEQVGELSLLAGDLLGAALSSVNWHEIIRSHENDYA